MASIRPEEWTTPIRREDGTSPKLYPVTVPMPSIERYRECVDWIMTQCTAPLPAHVRDGLYIIDAIMANTLAFDFLVSHIVNQSGERGGFWTFSLPSERDAVLFKLWFA